MKKRFEKREYSKYREVKIGKIGLSLRVVRYDFYYFAFFIASLAMTWTITATTVFMYT